MDSDFNIAYYTDVGLRKNVNQDSACAMVADTGNGSVCMVVVCDGMGGISKGEYASQTVVHEFIHWFESNLHGCLMEKAVLDHVEKEWAELLIRMDEQLRVYGNMNGIKVGTTATCMLFWKKWYLLAQSGDSRAYQIGRTIKQISEDQSFVQQQVKNGNLTAQEAIRHPKRNLLTNCIGSSRPSVPVFSRGRLERNSYYMLCTDGFVHEMSLKEMFDFLAPKENPLLGALQKNLKRMTELLKKRGERDNITALVVMVKRKEIFCRRKQEDVTKDSPQVKKRIILFNNRAIEGGQQPVTEWND